MAGKVIGRQRALAQRTIVPIGPKPLNPQEAWWYLSPQAKQLLQIKRMGGQFGGVPGTAPYWWTQDQGNPAVRIEATRFIARSLEEWRPEADQMISDWLGL